LHSIGHYQVEVNKGFGDVLIHPKYTLDAIFFIIDNVSKAGETLRGTGRLLFQRRIRGRSQSIDQGYRWMIQNGQDALEGVNAIGGGNDDGKIDARWQRRRLVLEQYGTTNGNLKKPTTIPPDGTLWNRGSGAACPTIHTGAPSGRATTPLMKRSKIRTGIMVELCKPLSQRAFWEALSRYIILLTAKDEIRDRILFNRTSDTRAT
jgi:hypothetical protein